MPKMSTKSLYVVGIVVVLVALVSGVIISKNKSSSDNPENVLSKQLTGKIVCAPKKASEATTLECAYGLQTSDGKNYLINTAKFPAGTSTQQYPNGTSVVVTGDVSSPTQELQIYDIEGVIAATQVAQQ